jgi:hypothetical protein
VITALFASRGAVFTFSIRSSSAQTVETASNAAQAAATAGAAQGKQLVVFFMVSPVVSMARDRSRQQSISAD